MKDERKIILLSVVVGLLAGLVDSAGDFLFFYEGIPFWDLALFRIPVFELWMRGILLLTSVGFGVIISRLFSQRRQAEEKLRESEEKYRALVEGTNDIPYSLDPKGTLTYIGPQVSRYGFSPEEMVSKNFLQFIFPEDREGLLSSFKKTIEAGEEFGAEFRIEDKGGNVRWLDEYGKVQRDESGRIVGLRGILRDITERKRMEEELKESNRLKDLFIDIMRHDILGPAGNIKSLLDIAAAEEDERGKRETMGHALWNARRLINIVESAAEVAKLEGEQRLETAPLDLGQVLRDVVEGLRGEAEERRARIENRAKGKYPVEANPMIGGVFANLVSNALKYSPESSKIVLDIEDLGTLWKASVTDFGEGIPDKYKGAIFERFKRKAKEGVKGSGLGLAIVKRIVELHKGRVWVEDNPEGGSIFCVELPKEGKP